MGNRGVGWCVAGLVALVALGGAAVPWRAATAEQPPPVAVYPLGDSITYGWGDGRDVPGGYRSVLDAALTQANVAHRLVGTSMANPSPTLSAAGQDGHDGHSGYRIEQVTADLDGVAGGPTDGGGHWLTGVGPSRPALVPDVVLVHLGTNDIYQRFDPAGSYDDPDPFDEAVERARFVTSMTVRLDQLVGKVQRLRPQATVVVATVIPLATGTDADGVPAEYAAAVRRLVARRAAAGQPVALVDAYGLFLTNGALTPGLISADGIHPTAAGYAVLGRAFADAVVAARHP